MDFKQFLTRKYIIGATAVVLVAGGGYFWFSSGEKKQETLTVHKGDFLQQVSVSGTVKAFENLDLSFEQGGIVRRVAAQTGDTVPVGKLLASQDISSLYAQQLQMQAGIDLQQAKLAQLLAGSSPESIAVAQNSVVSASQDVQSAYDNALTQMDSVHNSLYAASVVALTMQNTYASNYDQQGLNLRDARLVLQDLVDRSQGRLEVLHASASYAALDAAMTEQLNALHRAYDAMAIIRDQCDVGIYYTRVLATDKSAVDAQKTALTSAITSLKSSQQAVVSKNNALVAANAQFSLVKAPIRDVDIAVMKAQIEQAKASLRGVLADIGKRQIISPIAGVITDVKAKLGTTMGAGQVAVSLMSEENFQVESFVPEIYVAKVRVGNNASITLDAYGSDKAFDADVVAIDPSETINDGVSTYKVILQFVQSDSGFKNGMTANVVITTAQKSGAISVPQGLVRMSDGKKFVTVKQGEKTMEKEVVIGDYASNGNVEIVSGLNEGEEVVVR